MPPKEPKDGSHHHKFFSLRGKKKENRVKKGLSGALGASLGAIGFRPEDDENSSVSSKSSVHNSLQHQASRDSLKSIDMSLFNHLKRNKQDKHGSSNHVEPPREVPRIVTTTDAPSIVNRDLLKPKMSRPKTQDRTVSEASGFSAASDATAVPDESRTRNRSSILERAKAVVTSRSASPSPSTSPDATNRKQLGPRGNHIVTDAVASFRPKLAAELKGYKEAELAAGVSSENLFGFIASERLRRMPARGSRWDKILKWAEDFAKKLSLFEVTDDRFIPSSKDAVELILASIQILLMVSAGLRSSNKNTRLTKALSHTCSSDRRTARPWSGPLASSTNMASLSISTSVILACSSPFPRPGGTSACRWPTCSDSRSRCPFSTARALVPCRAPASRSTST